MINVLILSAGRRVELVRCFKKAKAELGIEGKIYAADITKTAPALQFSDEYALIPRINEDNYIDELIKLCKEKQISFVIPTIDTELEILSFNRERIYRESGADVIISDYETVKACCDKILTAKMLSEKGFNVPKVITDEMLLNGEYTFPLFIKPLDGSSSINAFKINNVKELEFFKTYVKNPIIQQCVSGTEYTVDCFCDYNGNAVTVVPRIRLATRSGEILKGRVEKNKLIIDTIKNLLSSVKFIGHITVQGFLTADNKFYFIEINPRFGGGAPMSIAVGADSCKNLFKLASGEKLKYSEDWEDNVTFSRFDDSVRIKDDDSVRIER